MTEDIATALGEVPFRVTDPEAIPAERYYDEAFFKLEKEKLWPHMWQMAARLEEVPEVGDYTEYTNLGHSVIIVRTKDGVKAFKNACRHRGVKLANGPGNCAREGFVCPFHGWRWNSEGENTFVFGRKIFSEDVLAKAEIDLVPVRIDFWAGCAWINHDNDAPSLREFLGPVADRMDARHADKLKMDWWFGTVLPTNWKLALEAFQEGYHTMQTHPQLYKTSPFASISYGEHHDGSHVNMDLDARRAYDMGVDFMAKLSEGMDGMVHHTEVAVLEKLRAKPGIPEEPMTAYQTFYGDAYTSVTEDGKKRGAPIFDIMQVMQTQPFYAVEFVFPHFFLLPMLGAMSSYRVRPLTAETCFFEIWSLVLRPEGEEYDTPTEPTILPYNSPDFPEIPRQDYTNLPIQQLGLHDIEYMRLSKDEEGMISNCHRLIDGYIAGVDRETLTKAGRTVNCGFQTPIHDLGF